MGMRRRLIRQKNWAAGTKVAVRIVELFLIGRREIVAYRQSPGGERNFENGITIIVPAGRRRELTVACDEVNVAVGIGGGTGVRLPDATFLCAGSNIENASLLQCVRVVRHDPAVVGADVAGRSPGDEDIAVCQEQGGALIFTKRVELGQSLGEQGPITLKGGANSDRGALFLGTRP